MSIDLTTLALFNEAFDLAAAKKLDIWPAKSNMPKLIGLGIYKPKHTNIPMIIGIEKKDFPIRPIVRNNDGQIQMLDISQSWMIGSFDKDRLSHIPEFLSVKLFK